MNLFLTEVLTLLTSVVDTTAQGDEDRRLIAAIQEGDQSALARLYDRYSSLVYTLVVRIVKETAEAEDVLQEIFLSIWNKAALFDATKGSVYTWIVTIARRKAIDRLRSKELANRAERLEAEDVASLPDAAYTANPLNAAIGSEYERLMREALATLSNEQRIVIELSYFDGYTQEQISQRLNVPLGTVKTRMRQGLMKLRDHLQERLV